MFCINRILALTEYLQRVVFSHRFLCFCRLASWFAYHLSNYEFRWTWEDWSDCLQVDKDHLRAKFVTEVLQNCIRLSYHGRIVESVPARFKVFVPDEPYLERKFDVENPGEITWWPGFFVCLFFVGRAQFFKRKRNVICFKKRNGMAQKMTKNYFFFERRPRCPSGFAHKT